MTYAEEFRMQFEKHLGDDVLVLTDDKGNATLVQELGTSEKQKGKLLKLVR